MSRDVMILAPHPDDAEIGMGGTIAALIEAGKSVVVVDLTNGEPTPHGTVEKRAAETKEASRALGIAERVLLDIPCREIKDSVENRKKVAAVIRQYQPHMLFLPYWDDGHPDHIAASALGVSARFYSKLVKTDIPHSPWYPRKMLFYFSTHLRLTAQPACVFDTTKYFDKKIASVKAYASQFNDNAANRGVYDMIERDDSYWGQQIGVRYAERFSSKDHIRIRSVESLLDS